MNSFDPGPGYEMEQFDGEIPVGAVAFHEDDGSWSYWVRKNPVPPLPIEPYTVVRVVWNNPTAEDPIFTLIDEYWSNASEGMFLTPQELIGAVANFSVLSRPVAATAKDVLDDVRSVRDIARGYGMVLDAIGHDFGVTANG